MRTTGEVTNIRGRRPRRCSRACEAAAEREARASRSVPAAPPHQCSGVSTRRTALRRDAAPSERHASAVHRPQHSSECAARQRDRRRALNARGATWRPTGKPPAREDPPHARVRVHGIRRRTSGSCVQSPGTPTLAAKESREIRAHLGPEGAARGKSAPSSCAPTRASSERLQHRTQHVPRPQIELDRRGSAGREGAGFENLQMRRERLRRDELRVPLQRAAQ